MMHVCVSISSWSGIFLVIKSRVLCCSEPLWLQQVTTKWNRAIKSTVQRRILLASPWSLWKNDFVVKAGYECRRRLAHCLKSYIMTLVGQPPLFSSGSLVRSGMSLLRAATAQKPGFDGDPRSPLGGNMVAHLDHNFCKHPQTGNIL